MHGMHARQFISNSAISIVLHYILVVRCTPFMSTFDSRPWRNQCVILTGGYRTVPCCHHWLVVEIRNSKKKTNPQRNFKLYSFPKKQTTSFFSLPNRVIHQVNQLGKSRKRCVTNSFRHELSKSDDERSSTIAHQSIRE